MEVLCKKCKEPKDQNSENFYTEKKNKSGFDGTCRECRNKKLAEDRKNNPEIFRERDRVSRESDKYKEFQDRYRKDNKEALKIKSRESYYKNKEPYLERSKKQKEKDYYKQYQKEYRLKNREKLSKYNSNKLHSDPIYKLKHKLRTRFRKLIKGLHKKNSVLKYLGCDIEFCKKHLEGLFLEGMSWENHGKLWHIDHIIPCSVFDFSNEEDLKICWHYTNLAPAFVQDNLKKSDKLPNGESGRDYSSYKEYVERNQSKPFSS